MTLGKRLIFGASGIIILIAFLGVTAMVSLNKVNRVSREVVARNNLIFTYSNQIEIALLQCRRHEKNYLLRGEDKYAGEVEKHIGEIKENLGCLQGLALGREFRSRMEEINSLADQYHQEFLKVVKDIKAGRSAEEAVSAEPRFVSLGRKIEPLAEEIATHARQEIGSGLQTITRTKEQTDKIITATFLVTVFLITSLVIILYRSITRPLQKLAEGARIIGAGNLDYRIGRDKERSLVKCWEELKCHEKDCPAYLASDLRCWGIAGTRCLKEGINKVRHSNVTGCDECPVYRKGLGDEMAEVTDTFNLMTENLKKTTVSRDYMDNIIECMIDTLIVVSPEARILTINRATCELLGYQEDELIGEHVGVIFAAAAAAAEELFKGTRLEKLIEEGSVRDYDMFYQNKSGEKIPVSFSGSVMRDKEGELAGIVGIARDMRGIKQIMEKEKKLAAAAAAAAASERKRVEELQKAYEEIQQKTESLESMNEKLRQTTEELERAKAGLEDKVRDRTKDLVVAKNSLEAQVKEKTKDLQAKVNELEKINRITMGRELRIAELKEEVARLKGKRGF